MGYSYLKPSILFGKKKKLVLLEVYFIIGHFLKIYLVPLVLAKQSLGFVVNKVVCKVCYKEKKTIFDVQNCMV